MAIAYTQSVTGDETGNTGTTGITSPSITPTAGHALIVTLCFDDNSTNVGTVSQNGGDATQATATTSYNNGGMFIWQAANYNCAGGAQTLKFTWGGVFTGNARIYVTEVS